MNQNLPLSKRNESFRVVPMNLCRQTITKAMKKLYTIFLLLLTVTTSQAQIVVTQSSNSQTLAQLLAGPGVTISNYTISCNANGSGTFNNVSSNLGIAGGAVLASGRVTNIPQVATNFASSSFTASGDAQLSTLTAGTIYDPCILEFDIVPQGPLLKFDYVFASEEYPEFVCSPYNDVFGFFITGPNPGGGNFTNKNMATIPGGSMPVAINSVNGGISGTYGGTTWNPANCQSLGNTAYYVNNLSPVNPQIVYDGMTTVLTATSAVVPCQTYHLKIAIADVADRIYDSGVFLSAYSFTSNPISVSAVSALDYAGFSSAFENCVGGTFTLTLSQVQTVDVYVNVNISGTAANGTDYTTIPAVVMIPAGQTSVNIDLNPLQDGLTESTESVTLAVLDPCTGAVSSSATITIRDDLPPTITASDTTLCLGQSTQLVANGGVTYAWSPATGLSNPNIRTPIATPTVTTTYTVTMQFGACTKTVSQTIHVSNPVVATTASPAGTVCNGGTVTVTASGSGGVSPYNYLWSTGATTPSMTVASGGTYNVTSTDSYGCTASATRSVTISNLNISGTTTNVSCMGGTNGSIDVTVTGSNAPFTYNWGGGVTSQDRTNIVAGTYTVTASNTAGCSVTASFTITQPATNLTTSATNTSVTCNGGNNGSINLSVSGGVSPYTYIWSNSATTQDISSLTANSYSVTVTDNNGCTASRSVTVTQPTAVTTSETHVNTTCFGTANGSINLSVGGGVGSYAYAWSNGAASQDLTGITAGTYTVTVSDGSSCTATRSITITQPTAVTPVLTPTNVACNGGNSGFISSVTSGGNSPYTFLWSNAATTQNISALAVGTYTLTATDANGCSASALAAITEPAVLTASTTHTNVNCFGGNNGTITLTVAGGTTPYTYNWGGGVTTQNRTALTAGTYTVTVTDFRSCTATATATITQPTALLLTNTRTNVSCNGGNNGSINITVSGGTSPYTYNWGGGVTTEDRTNLTLGTYNVTSTDANACTVSASISITQPTALTFAETHVNNTCNGGSTGSINITVGGGTSPYSYNWGGGVTTEDRTGLDAGTFTVTATDNNNCTVTGSATITQPAAINISEVVTDATCAPGNNGAITLTVTGGSSPYTYNWGGGVTTQNRSALFAGTYTVTVTDNTSCTAAKSISVSQLGTGMTLSTSVINVNCFGGSTGAIDLTVTGGTAPITYNWGGGITTQDRTTLTASNYSVTVTDGLSCSAIANATIIQPSAISISATTTNVLCRGAATGAINITATGGAGVLTYNWGSGVTTEDRTGIAAGSYTVTVTDANGCTATNASTITQPAAVVSAVAINTPVSCFSGSNGTVTLTPTGGTGAYTFYWSNGSISQNLSAVAAGMYNVTVTDANGCTATATSTVTQPASALSTTLTPTDLTCNNINVGSITNTVSGGTSPYTFNWGGGVTTQNRSGLAAGTYSVTVTDNRSCSVSSTVILTQPPAVTITITPADVLCNGGNNGAVTVSVTGGTGAYSYNWGGGITSQNRTGLTAGSYTLTVTDANSCTAASTTVIVEPSALTLTLNSGTSTCMSPTGTATAVTNNSGAAPYNYVWSNGGANSQNQNGLAPGDISVTVTDANSCSVSASVTVGLSGNNTDANFNFNGTLCGPNAVVTFTHAGSGSIINHNWDFGNGSGTSTMPSPNYTYPAAGIYNVTHIVERGFCKDTFIRLVTINSKPVPTSVVTNVSCNGMNNGEIDVSVSSGIPAFTYNWGGGVTTQDRTGLAPGTYTVTVNDANSCSATLSNTITQPTVLMVTYNNTNVTCNGGNNGAIDVTVVGGTSAYTYTWSGGVTTQDRTGLAGGTYTLTVTDANSCTSVNTIDLYQPNPVVIMPAVVNVTCFGQSDGAINLTVTGGTGTYFYTWAGSGGTTQNAVSIPAGVYTVSVTDANGCSTSSSSVVAQPAILTTSLSATPVSCFAGSNGAINSITTGGTAPYYYAWNDGNVQANRSTLTAGVYSATITDANGCSVSANITVAQPSSAVNVVVNSTNTLVCYGDNNGTINITASGGVPTYTYLWGDSSLLEDRTGMLGGTYYVTATDQNGCVAAASATINQPSQLTIDSIAVTNVLCFGGNTGSLIPNVYGGTTPYTYNWGAGVTTANRTNVPAGIYYLTVTDNNGCTATATATISQPVVPVTASTVTTNVSCHGGSNGFVDLTVTDGASPYTFNWGGGVTTEDRTSVSAGTYNVVVTDSNGCTATASSVVSQPAVLSISVASTTNVSCFGGNNGTINITATGGTAAYSYNWGGGITTQNRTGLAAGTYNVTISDANGCTATTGATITQPLVLSASYTTGQISCNNGNNGTINLTVTGGTSPFAYNWTSGQNTQNLNTLTAGTYDVTITDNNSCSATLSVTVSQPTAVVVTTVVTDVACFGGSTGTIDVTVNGGTPSYAYLWNGGVVTQDRTNLTAGVYQVTITDNNYCTTSISATVAQPATGLSATTSVIPVLCFGNSTGSIDLTATGGSTPYIYVWNDAVTTEDRVNVAAGTYSVTITDNQLCSATASATISQPLAALSVIATAADVSCFGGNNGAININVTGGTTAYSYDWGGGVTTQNRTGLTAGTYNVTVTDANSCTTTIGATITQPATALAVSVISTTNVSCFGGSNGAINTNTTGGTTVYSYNWGGGVTAQNRTGLASGTYTVTVSDANSCTATTSASITQPLSALAVSAASTINVLCFGGNNGAININATGGTTAYSYDWGGGLTTQNRTGLSAGTYNVTVTDANSCTATTSATITQPVAALAVAVTSTTNVSCFGGNNGTINISVTGGTTTYSYDWGGGVTTQNRNGLTSGTYNVTVTDANSCTATTNATIIQPASALAVAVVSTTNVSCFGGNNGVININATGGTIAYSYNWAGGVTTQNRTGLTAGTYNVTVSDANSCTATTNAIITEPAASLSVTATPVSVSCFAGSNGAITLTVTGGTAGYTYLWSDAANTQDRTNVAAGNYSVTVTDAQSCTATAAAVVTQPAAALSATTSVTNVSCNAGNNGTITLTVTGGTTTYSFNWNDAVVTQNRNNMSAGSYNVTVTDANSCSTTSSATITEPAVLTISATPTDVLCEGGSNGSISTAVNGGTAGYTYLWNDAVTTANRSNLTAGNYTVTVTDNLSCSASTSAAIAQPTALALSNTHTDVSCFGGNNGNVDITTTGGTSPYVYIWSNTATTQDISTLTIGTYTVSVTDAHNCSAVSTATVTQPTALQVSSVATNVLCNGASTGAVNITVSGGVTNYSYLWSNAAVSQNISSVASGTYMVTVTDANNCTTTHSQIVTQSAAIAIAETHINASCFGYATAGIDITVTGGNAAYSYLWSNGYNSEDISGVQANTYTVTVTDVNSCTGSSSISVGQPTAFSVSFNYNNVQCNGGADGNIDLTVSGSTPGYTYTWSNGAATQDLNNVYAGSYSVTVNDANGCVANANMTITQPNSLVVVTNTHTSVSCFGGSNGAIDISIQGGTFPFIYIWSDGANTQDRAGLSAGTYQLTVNDQNSCAVSEPVIITQPSALSVTLSTTDVLCNGSSNGSINSVITGGTANYSSVWSNGSATQNLTNIFAGTYSVTVTDANNCSLVQTGTVNQPATLTVAAVKTDVNCFGTSGGSIDVTVTGGIPSYNYVWSNAATTQDLTSVPAGAFAVNVTDANNCSASVSVVVNQPAALQIALAKTDPTCNGVINGSIDVTVTGGTTAYTYLWNTGATTEDLSSLGAGNFTVSVTDANGCSISGAEQLVMPVSMSATSTHTDLSCFGSANGTVSISVSGGNVPYTYAWSNGSSSQSINGLTAGSYSATVTDNKGCITNVNAVVVSEPTALNVATVATDVACSGAQNGTVDATITGGTPPFTYAWSNHTFAQDLAHVSANTYKVTVMDANNCTQTATATVSTLPQLIANAVADTLACATALGGIDLTIASGSAPYTFHWSNGATTEDLTSIHPGTYSVTVHDANGCPLDTSFIISNMNSFTVHASGGGTITLGQTIELHATTTGSAQTVFNWTPTYNLDCPTCADITVQPGQSTTYTVVGKDVNGCVAQDTVSVNVIADHTIFTPNAFTPNGDGNNDFFQMFGNLDGIRKFSIMVFDRWGEKVYDSEQVDFKWDGTYKGELLPPSVCVYVMKAVFLDGYNEKVFKGSITILR